MPTEYPIHELAGIFPAMSNSEFKALVDDVRQNNLLIPITLHEGKVLDGVHRQRACSEAGIEPSYVNFSGTDPVAFVLSVNLARRHLTESQRAMVAAKLANMKSGHPSSKGAEMHPSTNQAATMLKTSKRSVQYAKTVQKHGEPELVAAVEAGDIAVTPAAKIAKLPKDEQKKAIKNRNRPAISRKVKSMLSTPVAILNSLSWADARFETRQTFLDCIGVKSLCEAMSDTMKTEVLKFLSARPSEPPKISSGVIPDDLSVPEFLRRH